MPLSLPKLLAVPLERFLSYGADEVDHETALVIRRGRGFALIGLAVIFAAGIVSPLAHGMPEIAALSSVMLLGVIAGLAIGFLHGARWVVSITHVGMGMMLYGIVSIAVKIGGANDISVLFPVLLILVCCYVLGVRPALFWTLASIVGVAVAVFSSEPPMASVDGHPAVTLMGTFLVRAIVLFSVFALAAMERSFADQKSAELEFQARHDPLTELYTRRAFDEKMDDAVARSLRYGRRIALLVIDLDRFKAINDCHGHVTGDEVLRCIGNRIRAQTRATDSAARMGGDEFLILMEDIDEEKNVELFADRLLHSITRPIQVDGLTLRVGASIGISVFPDSAEDVVGFTRSADMAMYSVKSGGGNGVEFFLPNISS